MTVPYLKLVPMARKSPLANNSDMLPRINLWRGKSLDGIPGRWVYGEILQTILMADGSLESDLDSYIVVRSESIEYDILKVRVDPKTVGQYVNQTDNNGEYLFDDDIVETEVSRRHGYCYLVIWNGSEFVYEPFMKGAWLAPLTVVREAAKTYNQLDSHPYKIGNTHDNPELTGIKEEE